MANSINYWETLIGYVTGTGLLFISFIGMIYLIAHW